MNETTTIPKKLSVIEKYEIFEKKYPIILHILLTLIIISLIYAVLYLFKDNKESVFEFLIVLFVSIATTFSISQRKLKIIIEKQMKVVNDKITDQNNLANKKILEIATKNIEEKIYRKLISTNAIIPDKNNKLSITARILNDFPDENEYKDIPIDKEKTISIDFVRFLSYQNLLLTPKYLEYFFYRKDSVKRAIRIIALPTGHNQGLCQATLTYIFLSARYGYETYIIPEQRFKEFVKLKCSNDIELKKMIKGNPFILKIKDGEKESYIGEYIDYQENIENNGKSINANNKENWDILLELKKNSRKIVAKSTGFEEYIKSNIVSLNRHPIE